MARRVPFLDPPGALVHGSAAVGVAWLLQRAVNRGDLKGIPQGAYEDTLLALEAVDLAARAWTCRTAAAEFGRTATPSGPVGSHSADETITAPEAALILNVSERRARDLAATGLGRKASGTWLLDRAAVQAEARRRGVA